MSSTSAVDLVSVLANLTDEQLLALLEKRQQENDPRRSEQNSPDLKAGAAASVAAPPEGPGPKSAKTADDAVLPPEQSLVSPEDPQHNPASLFDDAIDASDPLSSSVPRHASVQPPVPPREDPIVVSDASPQSLRKVTTTTPRSGAVPRKQVQVVVPTRPTPPPAKSSAHGARSSTSAATTSTKAAVTRAQTTRARAVKIEASPPKPTAKRTTAPAASSEKPSKNNSPALMKTLDPCMRCRKKRWVCKYPISDRDKPDRECLACQGADVRCQWPDDRREKSAKRKREASPGPKRKSKRVRAQQEDADSDYVPPRGSTDATADDGVANNSSSAPAVLHDILGEIQTIAASCDSMADKLDTLVARSGLLTELNVYAALAYRRLVSDRLPTTSPEVQAAVEDALARQGANAEREKLASAGREEHEEREDEEEAGCEVETVAEDDDEDQLDQEEYSHSPGPSRRASSSRTARRSHAAGKTRRT
ncbi:hypothetical protein EIP86_001532 [Pleurotus ostreatoroseus]|nr:hypothetical protein EIP86_001532 [Pleurotus ostreatoroseus]